MNLLTSATAPWWSASVTSVVSFIAGQWIATRSTKSQRDADAEERNNEREATAAEADKARAAKAEEERVRREAEDAERAKAETDALFNDALDAIFALQAHLANVHYARGGLHSDSLRNFALALNKLRASEQARTNVWDGELIADRIVSETTDLFLGKASNTVTQATSISNQLTSMAGHSTT